MSDVKRYRGDEIHGFMFGDYRSDEPRWIDATDYDALQSTLASRDAEILSLRKELSEVREKLKADHEFGYSARHVAALESQLVSLRKSLDSKGEAADANAAHANKLGWHLMEVLDRLERCVGYVPYYVRDREDFDKVIENARQYAKGNLHPPAAIATEVKP